MKLIIIIAFGFIFLLLLGIQGYIMLGISKTRDIPVEGYLLGYESRGIATINLETGAKNYLNRNDSSHFYSKPTYNSANSCLYFLDRDNDAVFEYNMVTSKKNIIYKSENNWTVYSLSLNPSGSILVIADSNKYVCYDVGNHTIHNVIANIDAGQRPQWINDKEFLYGDDSIMKTDIDDSSRETILDSTDVIHGGDFIFLDNENVFEGNTRKMVLYNLDTKSKTAIRDTLPGTTSGRDFCYLGNNLITIHQQKHQLAIPELYVFDIVNGYNDRITKGGLAHAQYLLEKLPADSIE